MCCIWKVIIIKVNNVTLLWYPISRHIKKKYHNVAINTHSETSTYHQHLTFISNNGCLSDHFLRPFPFLFHLLTLICSTIIPTKSSPSPRHKRQIHQPIHNRHQPAHSPRRRLRRLRPRWSKPLGRLRQRLRLHHVPLPSLQLRRVLTNRLHRLRHVLLSSETWL